MRTHTAHFSPKLLRELSANSKRPMRRFLSESVATQAAVWPHLPTALQGKIARDGAPNDLVSLLEALDPDHAADLLQLAPSIKRSELLRDLERHQQETVAALLAFPAETAAGLMNLDYIQVDDTATIATVGQRFRDHEKRTGRTPAVLVVCKDKLTGYLPVHQLALRKPTDKIRKHVRPVATIHAGGSHDDVAQTFRTNPHSHVAVLNENGSVLGIIFSDDILRLLKKQESSSLLSFAGVKDEETVLDSTFIKVRRRYSWLIINLGTAFLAASTVGLFEDTIAAFVLLAVYMPIVAGMGGNAATQTLAVVVRGIALQQIDLATSWRTLWREIFAGLINGVINGVIVAGVIMIMHQDIRLALVLGFAMVANLVVAGFFGTLIPLIMKRLGYDPATSATIFITTATDVLGFLAFLGLATAILR